MTDLSGYLHLLILFERPTSVWKVESSIPVFFAIYTVSFGIQTGSLGIQAIFLGIPTVSHGS